MRRRKSVLQAMRSTRIFRHVSADAADRLRGRIRSVKILLRRDASGDVEIDDPGFDDHAGVWKINLKDAIHPRQANDNPAFNRHGPASEARAGTAHHERDSVTVADTNS